MFLRRPSDGFNPDDIDHLQEAFDDGKIYPVGWDDDIPDNFLLVEAGDGALYAVDMRLPDWIVDQL